MIRINLNVQIVLGNTKPSQSNEAEMPSLTEYEKKSLIMSEKQLTLSYIQTGIGIATLIATLILGFINIL